MPFIAIEGTFHVVGYSPDGDSIKFKANQSSLWDQIKGKTIRPNPKDHVQIRVEAIDSLETHYKGDYEQPETLADAAGDHLMSLLGITNVIWGPTHKRVTSANDGTPGFLLARETGPFGRPISFLFAGNPGFSDGDSVFLDTDILKESANYQMLLAGHAYPLFYETLFFDLRNEMALATQSARGSGLGIWAEDQSRAGFDASDLDALQTSVPILPKLFRRIAGLDKDGKPLSDLKAKLAEERVTILPAVQHTDLDEAVDVVGSTVTLKHDPENLIVGTVIR